LPVKPPSFREPAAVVAAVDFRQPPEAGYTASICGVNLAGCD
jgi:hypothetical protein